MSRIKRFLDKILRKGEKKRDIASEIVVYYFTCKFGPLV